MPFPTRVHQNSATVLHSGLQRLVAGERLKYVGFRWVWEVTNEYFPDGTLNMMLRRGLAAMTDLRTVAITRAGRQWLAAHEPQSEVAA